MNNQDHMTYERFGELWDALVDSRPMNKDSSLIIIDETAGDPNTIAALIAYGQGDKSKIPKL